MLFKGLIVEINKTHMVVIDDHSRFVKINLKLNHKIGQQIFFTKEDQFIAKKLTYLPILKRRHLVAVAAMLMLVLSFGQIATFEPDMITAVETKEATTEATVVSEELLIASIVTVDINPSVKLILDTNDQVIHVIALNSDAETLKLDILMGEKVEDAVELIVEQAKLAGYINTENFEEDYVLITTIPAKGKVLKSEGASRVELEADDEDSIEITEGEVKQMNQLRLKIEEKIANSPELQEINVAIIKATKVEMRLAEEKHVPIGLYIVKGKLQIDDETSVKEYFSKKENIEQFKEKGSVVEKRDASKMNLAQKFIAKLDSAGVDTAILKTELADENVDIDQLLDQIKALWATVDDDEDTTESTSDTTDEEKPGKPGKPENPGKPDSPGNSNDNKGKNN